MRSIRLIAIGLFLLLISGIYAQGVNIQETRELMNSYGAVWAFCSSGQYSYILFSDSQIGYSIKVFDVSDHTNVHFISAIPLAEPDPSDYYLRMELEGDILCIYTYHKVMIFELSTPTSVEWRAELLQIGHYRGADLSGTCLLAVFGDLLTAWNLAEPTQPILTDSLTCPNATSFYRSGLLGYVGYQSSGYELVNVSDPADLISLGPNQNTIQGTLKAVMGTTLIMQSRWDVWFFDATDPLYPVYVGGINSGGWSSVVTVLLLGSKLAVRYVWDPDTYRDHSFRIYDISTPNLPQELYSESLEYEFFYSDESLYSDESHRMIMRKTNYFAFYDLEQNPIPGDVLGWGAYTEMLVSADHAFIYQNDFGISSHDLSEAMPAPDGEFLHTLLNNMAGNGNLMVTTDCRWDDPNMTFTDNVLRFYSVSDPANVSLISTHTVVGGTRPTEEIRITGDKLLLSNAEDGVLIYDISDIQEPVLWSTIDDQRNIVTSVLEANYLYSGGNPEHQYSSVVIYNLENPAAPVELSTIPLGFYLVRMQKQGNLLYLSGSNQEFRIWDVGNPSQPIEYGSFTLPAVARDFQIHNNALIILCSDSFYIYKLSDALQGVPVGFCSLEGVGQSMAVHGNDVIIGTDLRVAIYDCEDAYALCTSAADHEAIPQVQHLSSYPNPSRGFTTLSYKLREPGNTTIEIYNIRGQRIRMIDAGQQAADTQTTIWDGKDSSGKACPSGVYLYKVQSNGYGVSGKLLKMK